MTDPLYLRAGTVRQRTLEVDRDAGVIRGAAVLTIGTATPANAPPFEIDKATLAQVRDAINSHEDGIRVRMTHSELYGRDGLADLVGVLRDARIDGDRVVGDVWLGEYAATTPRGDMRSFLIGLAEEHPTNLGLSIVIDDGEIQDIDGREVGRVRSVFAVDLVGEPAGNPAGLLSKPAKQAERRSPMDEQTTPAPAAAQAETPTPEATPIDGAAMTAIRDQETRLARQAEADRVEALADIVEANRLDGGFLQRAIVDGWSSDEARTKAAAIVSARNAAPAAAQTDVRVGENLRGAGLIDGAVDALMIRLGKRTCDVDPDTREVTYRDPVEASRLFRGRSGLEVFRRLASEVGVDLDGATDGMLAGAALGRSLAGASLLNQAPTNTGAISDFGDILANTLNKILSQGYADAPRYWRGFANQVTAPDFKTVTRPRLSATTLSVLAEGDDIAYVKLSDEGEQWALATYARGIAITRRALINDDLSAFARVAGIMGYAAGQVEDQQAFGVLNTNPNLQNGSACWRAANNNYTGTASLPAITVENLNVAVAAIRNQKALGNATDPLDITPGVIVVPATEEVTALEAVGALHPVTNGPVANPYSGRFSVISSARLTDRWFVTVAPGSQADSIDVGFLEGESTPITEVERDFDSKVMKWSVTHNVAAAPVEFRSSYLFEATG